MTGDDPQRPILVARLKGRRQGEALALLSHVDVVPAGDVSKWEKPPFAGERGEGATAAHLIGRGTLDMKGQTVASLLAFADLVRQGIVPLRDIVFVVESGEETFNQDLGMGWLQRKRPDLLEGVTDVWNEGGVNEVNAQEIARFGIEVMQKAILSVWIDARDRKPLEEIQAAARARDLTLPFRIVPAVHDFVRFILPSRSDVWGRRLLDHPEELAPGTDLWPLVPEVYKSLIKDSIYVGPIKEDPGTHLQTLEIAWTMLPGSRVADAEVEIDRWVKDRGLTKRIQIRSTESVATPTEGPAWRAALDVLGLDAEHAPVGPYVLSGQYTSSSHVRASGLRAYGISPFAVSIFDAGTIHHANERISVPFFVDGVERMKRLLREFATAP